MWESQLHSSFRSEHLAWHSSSLVPRNTQCLAGGQPAAAIQHALPPRCPAVSRLHHLQASAQRIVIDNEFD